MQELNLLAIIEPLQHQSAGLRPVDKPEWATAQRLPVKRYTCCNACFRQDADHQVAGKQRVGAGKMKIQGRGIDHLDVRDQAQRGCMR